MLFRSVSHSDSIAAQCVSSLSLCLSLVSPVEDKNTTQMLSERVVELKLKTSNAQCNGQSRPVSGQDPCFFYRGVGR